MAYIISLCNYVTVSQDYNSQSLLLIVHYKEMIALCMLHLNCGISSWFLDRD